MIAQNQNNHRDVPEGNGKDLTPCVIHILFKQTGSIEMAINVEGAVNVAQLSLAAAELNFIADQLRIKAAMIEAQKWQATGIAIPNGAGVPNDLAKGILH